MWKNVAITPSPPEYEWPHGTQVSKRVSLTIISELIPSLHARGGCEGPVPVFTANACSCAGPSTCICRECELAYYAFRGAPLVG